ncbi:MAG: nucleotidyltransferase domain-containing protein [Armatimonadetes bacterium]|nr:nucleotidyltransferase domain-containing protein [Armatimonadota bacterium]
MIQSARKKPQISPSILGELLTSATRERLLTLFLTHPTGEYYVRELHRRTGFSLRALQHELARLERLGLLVTRRQGREKYYRANERHPLFPDLKRIVYKTAGLGDVLREALAGIAGVGAAFIYGSVAKGGERVTSDIDLMVIGSPNPDRLHDALKKAEKALGRDVNVVTMGTDEWKERRRTRDAFVYDLLRSEKILLIGNERTLRRT